MLNHILYVSVVWDTPNSENNISDRLLVLSVAKYQQCHFFLWIFESVPRPFKVVVVSSLFVLVLRLCTEMVITILRNLELFL